MGKLGTAKAGDSKATSTSWIPDRVGVPQPATPSMSLIAQTSRCGFGVLCCFGIRSAGQDRSSPGRVLWRPASRFASGRRQLESLVRGNSAKRQLPIASRLVPSFRSSVKNEFGKDGTRVYSWDGCCYAASRASRLTVPGFPTVHGVHRSNVKSGCARGSYCAPIAWHICRCGSPDLPYPR